MRNPAGPVVVELFTSQGCSSCPPADEALDRLGGDVLTLAYHVDYWDHLGWVDPYSQQAFTGRQVAYSGAFGLRTIYTPQAVINGRAECVGSDERRLAGYIEQEASRAKGLAPTLGRVQWGGDGVEVEVRLPQGLDTGAVLNVVVIEQGPEQLVERGENAGRKLAARHAVRVLWTAGCDGWTGGNVAITLPENVAGPLGVAGFLQDGETMAVLGATPLTLRER